MGSREEEALDLFKQAVDVAPTLAIAKSFVGTGRLRGALELEEAHSLMRDLEESAVEHDPIRVGPFGGQTALSWSPLWIC